MLQNSPFKLPRKTPFGLAENLAEWATGLSQLDLHYSQRPAGLDSQSFLRYTLEVLNIDYQIVSGQLESVPQHGATIVVANHPLGCVEGVILAELLLMMRSDVKVMANALLKNVPELDPLFIGVDVFNGPNSSKTNLTAARQASRHLDQGGLLLMFPAGEVSQPSRKHKSLLEDKEWSRSLATLVRKSKATTLPIFIQGANSRSFYLAGKVHPMVRTALLGRELLNKSKSSIGIKIGEPITFKEISRLNEVEIINYLRLNTYLLNAEKSCDLVSLPIEHEPLATPVFKQLIKQELSRLPADSLLLEYNNFKVYCGGASEIPNTLREIGRIREQNFRAVGEGTGKAIDLDSFDQDYLHLFVWDQEQESILGAYRLGLSDRLVTRKGINALYSKTQFEFDKRFLTSMGPAIELGRSVIAQPYQKSMQGLLLLWKGIGEFIHRHPHYTHLFGPVSISNEYSQVTRQLLAQTMSVHHYDNEQASLVRAVNPPSQSPVPWNLGMLTALADIQLLSKVIERLDSGKSVPVLLRQYLNMNGKLVCFNVDPDFNNTLDGLIVTDLRKVPLKTLSRYMGATKAKNYLQRHDTNRPRSKYEVELESKINKTELVDKAYK